MNVRGREELEAGSDAVGSTEERSALRERVAELEAINASQAAALLDAEARYRALVEAAPINVFHKDAAGRFTFGNRRFCESLGRTWDEIVGRTDFDFFSRKLAQKYRRDDVRVMETGQSWHDVEEHLSPDGEKRYVEVSKTPLYDSGGRLVGVQGLFRDITAQRGAELALGDSEARYRSLVESLPLSTWCKGLDGHFTFANRLFCERVGLTLEELIGRTDLDLFRAELAEKYRRDDERVVQSGQVLEAIEEFRQPEGNKLYVQVLKAPVHDAAGRIVGTQGVFWDVTARVEAEAQVERARLAAEEASRAKGQFLANMSHEIRTPLNAVIGMTGLLLETTLSQEQEELTVTVRNSADGLLGIINDILDCSKMEAGKLAIESIDFDLGEVLEGVTDLLGERAHSKKLELITWIDEEVPRSLRGDPGRIRQILTNLAANAVKFTGTGEVIIEVTTGAREGNRVDVRFCVSDTGIGIPPEARRRIFQAFVQADGSTTRRFGGTGLGLAISKQLTELMRGEIGCESEPGKGSTFWFQLPLELQASQKPRPDCLMFDGLRVLVAEPNPASRERLCRRLQSWRMRPSGGGAATGVLQAIEQAAQQGDPFQIILADQGLAEIGGVDLAREIKAQERSPKPAVVLLTGVGQMPAEPVLQESGVASHIVKPLKESRLYETLAAVVRGAVGGAVRPRGTMPVPAEPNPERPLRVLLAEDNPINQKVALRQLQKLGYSVDAVANGLEALKAQRAIKYDVILMDCQMPEMDGFEATRRIRVEEAELRLPPSHIIAMTANALAGDRELCLAAGMDDYLSKPVRVEALSAALRRGVEKTTMERVQESKEPLLNAETVQGLRELRMPGEPDPISELVDLFLADAPSLVTRIRGAFTSRDIHELERVSHTLKGSASNLGADRLAQSCFRVMSLSREGQLPAEPEIRQIESEFDIVRPELEKLKLEGQLAES